MIEDRQYKLVFTERLLGSSPKNERIYSDYIASKAPDPEVDGVEELETIQTVDQKGLTGFHSDSDGIYILDYMVKGFLKNAGNILKDNLKIKALRSKVENHLFVFPRHIWLAEQIDGIYERPLRAQTAQGPRVSLAASEYLEPGISIEITLSLLSHKELTWDVVEQILDYGKYMGIGQFRSGSFGRFTWERLPEKAQKSAA